MAILLLVLMLLSAVQAVHATRLLVATIWLAVLSALLATLLYLLGAWEIAVIELSVGAGLVTVLMVFVITMVGDVPTTSRLAQSGLLVGVMLAILGLLVLIAPSLGIDRPTLASAPADFATTLWAWRGLDVLAQIVLLFAGVLGILGLLSPVADAELSSVLPTATLASFDELDPQWQGIAEGQTVSGVYASPDYLAITEEARLESERIS